MVSLYRAWAAWRGVSIPGAPDALVQVGGVRFAAHARLLAAHSGYFKSVLSRQWNPAAFPPSTPSVDDFRQHEESKATTESEGYDASYERRDFEAAYGEARPGDLPPQIANEENIVYLPNISAQQFWPLLAYMYTGYLELTPENIYQVLLATHLLHMPRALELCRNFLAQGATAPLPSLPTTVIKPIPSRKLPAFLPAPNYRPIYSAEPPIPFLGSRYDAPFKPVDPLVLTERQSAEDKIEKEKSPIYRQESLPKESPLIIPTQAASLNVVQNVEKPKPSETSILDKHSHEASVSSNRENELGAINLIKSKKAKSLTKKNKCLINAPTKPPLETCVVLKEKTNTKVISASDDKVVIDVACCDGPVRFHRVLNSAYKANGLEAVRETAESSDSDDSYVEIEEDSRSRSDTPYDNCNAFSKSLQKQMSENIRTMNAKQNENEPAHYLGEDDTQKVDVPDPDASNSDVSSKCQQETIYTCVYCNHTFKSQYCYQKHARRHINPVTIDAVNQLTTDTGDGGCCKPKGTAAEVKTNLAGPRREVRLLDMNVQYYPCKTCGSKFPSYYFVHKHRKMCHADELEGGAEHAKTGGSAEKRKKYSSSGTDAGKEGPIANEVDVDNNEESEKRPAK